MVDMPKSTPTKPLTTGVELEEVDFKEFDRRKTPRLNSYQSFTEYTESLDISDDDIDIKKG